MKHWIAYVQQHINQLTHVALKETLQQHFNSEATCLEEVFCRYFPVQPFSPQVAVNTIDCHPVLSLIHTYGPLPLIKQLHTLLPPLEEVYGVYSRHHHRTTSQELMDYQVAWRLIHKLQQNPYDLIETLQKAEPTSLQSLKKITEGSVWASLITLFLEQPVAQWSEEEKTQYIDYFKNPQWVNQCIELMKFIKRRSALLSSSFFSSRGFC